MPTTDLNKLLKHELGDILFAEKTFLKGLKKMSKEVNNPLLRDRIVQHAQETERQIENVQRAFEAIGLKAKAQKCDGALGLTAEHDSFKEDEKPSEDVLEAFDLGSGLRVEHYEIAAYRSAIALARALGETGCADLLTENLEQEVQMASFLETNAPAALQTLLAQAAHEAEVPLASGSEPEAVRGGGAAGRRGTAASKGAGRAGNGSRSTRERGAR